ncbi:hypothetical protein WG66_015136 [Moniliophthora roreri]|uniref:DNA replication regulator SLD2 n=1 Tax=Moniliophthora roreri TaxID=221103 RepID=A0A0W0FGA8_MONRR|nr:hypothetical protein WG66_015136 [Moniliophthora roreri]
MSNITSIRAEIKAWEREFKEKNGRNASVEDIRKNPTMTEKYKLYKKLSKGSSQSQSQSHSQLPSLPKSRPVEVTAPLSSFNPFSPQKNKGKQPQSPVKAKITPRPSNPFATPSKNKQKAAVRVPSPVLPPVPELSTSSLALRPTGTQPEPPSAVVRARKRLRGEPVSPSPNKEKRRRVYTQTTLAFARRNSPSSSDNEDRDPEETSFIDDSPMKAPPGSKSFKRLFEDAESPNTFQAALARAKANNPSNGLFGKLTKDSSAISFDDEMDCETEMPRTTQAAQKKKVFNGRPRLPAKDNLHAADPQTSQQSSKPPKESGTTRKRVFSDVSDGKGEKGHTSSQRTSSEPTLIPPSPPPADSSSSNSKHAFKGKGKAASRKKAKLDQDYDDEHDGNSSDGAGVRVRSYTRGAARAGDVKADDEDSPDLEMDSDPILRYFRPANNQGGGFTVFEGDEDYDDIGTYELGRNEESGSFEVNLPDKMRNVLALSSDTRTQDAKEELLAEELLYGRRMTHYNAARGGEIWDVGDVSGDGQDSVVKRRCDQLDDEDDWEGEPIPWETGEL